MNDTNFLDSTLFLKIKEHSKVNANFILKAFKELSFNGIKLILEIDSEKIIPTNIEGCFDSIDKIIYITISKEFYSYDSEVLDYIVAIFTHEYCHFIQWKLNTLLWRQTKCDTQDILNSKQIGMYEFQALKSIQKLERDCERRVLKLIKNKVLDLNYEWYLNEANSYIIYHDILAITKKWFLYPLDKDEKEILYNLLPKNKLVKGLDCLKSKKYEYIVECIKAVY